MTINHKITRDCYGHHMTIRKGRTALLWVTAHLRNGILKYDVTYNTQVRPTADEQGTVVSLIYRLQHTARRHYSRLLNPDDRDASNRRLDAEVKALRLAMR